MAPDVRGFVGICTTGTSLRLAAGGARAFPARVSPPHDAASLAVAGKCRGRAMMLQAMAERQKGYRTLEVPTFITAEGDDRVVDHWHSNKLHQECT
jgi:hypothetical protein